jgi:hypothetical protein
MLDTAEVERLAAQGAALTVDQAVAFALGESEPAWPD